MSLLTKIIDIEARPWRSEPPWSALDEPVSGAIIYGDKLEFRGWALGKHGPPSRIDAVLNGARVECCDSRYARFDVERDYAPIPETGNSGYCVRLDVPLQGEFEVRLTATFEEVSVDICGVGARRYWRDPPDADQRVSVLIPCYNQARFLGDALKSVLAQTYPPFEVIVVDDGSTDDPGSIASDFGVRCIRQTRGGPSAARNTGLAAASGDFVVYLDGDNVLFPHALEAGLHAFEDHPEAAFVWGVPRFIDREGRRLVREVGPQVPLSGAYYAALLARTHHYSPDNFMFQRCVLDEIGGFDGSVDGAEDYDLYLRIARSYPVHFHGTPLSGYRIHDTQFSRDHAMMITSVLTILDRHRDALADASLKAAWAIGVEGWRAAYGVPLVDHLRDALSDRRWRDAVRDTTVLARWYPTGLRDLLFSQRRQR